MRTGERTSKPFQTILLSVDSRLAAALSGWDGEKVGTASKPVFDPAFDSIWEILLNTENGESRSTLGAATKVSPTMWRIDGKG